MDWNNLLFMFDIHYDTVLFIHYGMRSDIKLQQSKHYLYYNDKVISCRLHPLVPQCKFLVCPHYLVILSYEFY